MLSRRLRGPVRSNAVAALFERRDVFMHSWIESCATVAALRIIIHEQEEERQSKQQQQEAQLTLSSPSSSPAPRKHNVVLDAYAAHLRMRCLFRDAVFRLHVPRTIAPTRIGRDLWAPLRASSLSSSSAGSSGGRHAAPMARTAPAPDFSDEEFQRWIEKTSCFPASKQVGGEGYVPLPVFVSCFESLCAFRNNGSAATQPAMGKRSKIEQEMRSGRGSNSKADGGGAASSSPLALCCPATVHAVLPAEAAPYRKLMRYLDDGAKADLLHTLAEQRELFFASSSSSSSAAAASTRSRDEMELAQALFRAAVVHGGGSTDAQFALSLVRDLQIGDLLVSDERDGSLRQFGFSLRRSAEQTSKGSGGGTTASTLRGISSRARTFLSSAAASDAAAAALGAKCFPDLVENARGGGADGRFPAKRPFSKRPGSADSAAQDAGGDGDAAAESDFHLCCWTSPVEPLLFDPFAAEPRDFWAKYRRRLELPASAGAAQSGSSSSFDANVIEHLAPPVVAELLATNKRDAAASATTTTACPALSPRALESLRDFDAELLRRLSSDVGGFAAAIVPCCVAVEQEGQQQLLQQGATENDFETSLAAALLPRFTSGRVGVFPSVLGADDAPIGKIWLEQFLQSAVGPARAARVAMLQLDGSELLDATLEPTSDAPASSGSDSFDDALLWQLCADPFTLDYVNDGRKSTALSPSSSSSLLSSGAAPPLGFSRQTMLLPLLEMLCSGSSGGGRAPYLCLLLMKAPPGLTSARFEEPSAAAAADSGASKLAQQRVAAPPTSTPSSSEGGSGSSIVQFANTWEHDHYLPQSGPPVPYHFADHMPTFGYLDEQHVGRRRAEIERRQLHQREHHPLSELLFSPHPSRAHAVAGPSAHETSAMGFDNDDDDNNEVESTSSNARKASSSPSSSAAAAAASSSSSSATSFVAQQHEVMNEVLTPEQRGMLRESYRLRSSNSSNSNSKTSSAGGPQTADAKAYERMRRAQLQFGTIGAIFASDLKKKQLTKAALQKQLSREVDRHLLDERFVNEKVMPVGERMVALHNELSRVGTKTRDEARADVMARRRAAAAAVKPPRGRF